MYGYTQPFKIISLPGSFFGCAPSDNAQAWAHMHDEQIKLKADSPNPDFLKSP